MAGNDFYEDGSAQHPRVELHPAHQFRLAGVVSDQCDVLYHKAFVFSDDEKISW